MDKLTVRDADVAGKRVFVRVDFNVPLADGKVTDDSRIRAVDPDDQRCCSRRGASVILASHLGRPDGKVQDGLRLRPVGQRLTELLRRNVPVTGDALGLGTEDAVKRLRPGEVLLLENLRFHAEEEANDPAFAAALAAYADVYVNDAFGTAHRAHASTVGIAQAPAGLRRAADGARDRDALEAPRCARAAVRGDPRRRQGVRQDRGHRQPADQGRHARPRRRHGQHVPAGPGQGRSARAWPSPTASTTPGGSCRRPPTTASGSSCRSTSSWPRRSPAAPSTRRSRPRRSRPRGTSSTSARPART